jgi:DNA invertase Pin-like site-specific DNA recombinase
MSKTRVYSYLRFSDPKQEAGHSVERQLAFARKWADDHGAELDTDLTMRDEGLSAYHQRHVKHGALGVFLRAVDEGRIAPGSILIVEGLDRLSRAEPLLAQAQLAQIINAGISVVTASDGKVYNRDQLKAQPMDLVYSLLVMIRAHEESDTKSKRVSAAVRRQCEAWQAGTFKGVIRNGKDPAWLRWDGERFIEIQERAEPLRQMLQLWLDGHGYASAWRTMQAAGADMSLLPKTEATFYRMLSKRYVIGTKTISAGGEDFELEGYYPPLIDVDTFNRVMASRGRRRWKRGPTATPGVLTGSGITFCGYCGSPIVAQNSAMSRGPRKDGSPREGNRRIRCQHSADSCISGSCSVEKIERAVFAYCADQMRLDALFANDFDVDRGAAAALAKARARVAEIEAQLARVTAALLADDGPTPITFARKARELEADLAQAQAAEEAARNEVNAASSRRRPSASKEWQAIIDGVLSLDVDARLKARQMVIDTFSRIAIYMRGIVPADGPSPAIDLILVGHGGASRMLRISRKDGALVELEDVSGASSA